MWGRCRRQLGRVAGALAAQLPWLPPQVPLPQAAFLEPPLSVFGYAKTRQLIVCHFCTTADHDVSYKELKDLLDSKAILLIDVREKWEIGQYGKIPGSICIPLGEVAEALQMSPLHFKEKYNQDMPSKSDQLVFSCPAGVRSKAALAAANSLGFSRAKHYAGGFKEWAEYDSSEKK